MGILTIAQSLELGRAVQAGVHFGWITIKDVYHRPYDALVKWEQLARRPPRLHNDPVSHRVVSPTLRNTTMMCPIHTMSYTQFCAARFRYSSVQCD